MLLPLTNKQFVDSEFRDLELGDKRLNNRVLKVVSMINSSPSCSFPSSAISKAELKAFYRFFQNENINEENVLETHYARTIQRCIESNDNILLVTDTTYVNPAKQMDGLKTIGSMAKKTGLRVHYMIAVTASNHECLGMTDFIILDDNSKQIMEKESEVWKLVAESTIKRIKENYTDKSNKLISRCTYVADRDADDYSLFLKLNELGLAYVIRCQTDRYILSDEESECLKISSLQNNEIKHGLPYSISVSNKVGRKGKVSTRNANVQRSVLLNQDLDPSKTKSKNSEIVSVDIVIVREINPPSEDESVCWKLFTSHFVEKESSSESIVKIYKGRWVIEELNKCAKTGVRVEERQFTDLAHFKPFCAITFVVAWRLLSIRDISMRDEKCPAELVFDENELDYLIARKLSKGILTVKQALNHIATEGGFLGSYSHPGWIVLWRGWFKFSLKVEGFAFANSVNKNSS